MKRLNVVIVGGGLAGLSCAACLANTNKVVVVLETSKALGGLLLPEDKITAKILNEKLGLGFLPGDLKNDENPVEFLRNFIEDRRGEIVTETPVTTLGYNKEAKEWSVVTVYGDIHTSAIVVATPSSVAHSLLKPIFGREEWFKNYFTDPNSTQSTRLADVNYHGLYLAGDYLYPSKKGNARDAILSGKKAAAKLNEAFSLAAI